MLNEIKILRLAKQQWIIKLYDVYESKRHVNLVFEYMGGGTLMSKFKEREPLSEQIAITIFIRLMEAVAYLHNNKIVHRDLKPENIFLQYATVRLSPIEMTRKLI